MATTIYQKQLYEGLRKSLVSYEHNKKCIRDKNLDQIIKFSRKYGCKQLIYYAAMSNKQISAVSNPDAKQIKSGLTKFVRDYYETGLLLSVIYGAISMMNSPNCPPDFSSTIVESINNCMTFYLQYDGIRDSEVVEIISTFRNKGILACLQALRFRYTSSGFAELTTKFYSIDDKYLPLISVLNALNPFLAECPIAEIA